MDNDPYNMLVYVSHICYQVFETPGNIVQMLMIFYWSLVGESEIKKAAATVKALVRRQKPKNLKNIKGEVLEKLQELSMKIKSCGGKLTANRLRRFFHFSSKICLRV